jgi:hypothetical protein
VDGWSALRVTVHLQKSSQLANNFDYCSAAAEPGEWSDPAVKVVP